MPGGFRDNVAPEASVRILPDGSNADDRVTKTRRATMDPEKRP